LIGIAESFFGGFELVVSETAREVPAIISALQAQLLVMNALRFMIWISVFNFLYLNATTETTSFSFRAAEARARKVSRCAC